jgi:hypothetical protein
LFSLLLPFLHKSSLPLFLLFSLLFSLEHPLAICFFCFLFYVYSLSLSILFTALYSLSLVLSLDLEHVLCFSLTLSLIQILSFYLSRFCIWVRVYLYLLVPFNLSYLLNISFFLFLSETRSYSDCLFQWTLMNTVGYWVNDGLEFGSSLHAKL